MIKAKTAEAVYRSKQIKMINKYDSLQETMDKIWTLCRVYFRRWGRTWIVLWNFLWKILKIV